MIQLVFQVCEVIFSMGFFKWSETRVMQKHLNPILYLSLQIEVKKKRRDGETFAWSKQTL